jgi:hypothetical protein
MDTKRKTRDEARRDFIKKAGKLAIYTPPAMLTLMQPSYTAFAKSGGCNNGFGNGDEGCSPNPNGANYNQDE